LPISQLPISGARLDSTHKTVVAIRLGHAEQSLDEGGIDEPFLVAAGR